MTCNLVLRVFSWLEHNQRRDRNSFCITYVTALSAGLLHKIRWPLLAAFWEKEANRLWSESECKKCTCSIQLDGACQRI